MQMHSLPTCDHLQVVQIGAFWLSAYRQLLGWAEKSPALQALQAGLGVAGATCATGQGFYLAMTRAISRHLFE